MILLVALLACQQPTGNNPEMTSYPMTRLVAYLDSIFLCKIKMNEPGVSLLVAYDGEILMAKGYGLRDLKTHQPITSSTNFEMASVSKQFTALAILCLVDQGKLSLSDTVFDLFPYETFRGLTIEQLINHTSGIADAEEALYASWDSTEIATNQDVLDWYIQENRKLKPPGVHYQYNNGAYEVLPLIVEKLSGETFENFMQINVFNKAGMTNTMIYNLSNPVDVPARAYYYHQDSSGKWNMMDGHPLTGLLGAGGVYTNLRDYFKYDWALRNQQIFSKSTHDLIFKPSATYQVDGMDRHYAMGWIVTDSSAHHSGGWFGVNTYVKRYLNKPLTLAFFANKDSFFEDDLIEITDSYINS